MKVIFFTALLVLVSVIAFGGTDVKSANAEASKGVITPIVADQPENCLPTQMFYCAAKGRLVCPGGC